MKGDPPILVCALLSLMFCAGSYASSTTLELVTNSEPQQIFFGAGRKISLTFRNSSDQDYEGSIRARVFQTTSATAVPLSEAPWKTLRVLPRQTVLESAQLDFPAVRAGTEFLVQWRENTNQVIGTTEVWVYPTNLMAELKPLAGEDLLGVFDPQNRLKPLLHQVRVEFTDLENCDLEKFSGKLAIIGPFESKAQMREGLADEIGALAKKNVGIVWLQPPPNSRDKLLPSFYALPQKQTAIVVVQSMLVSDLPENPQSQLHLIHFCKLALAPEPWRLPYSAIYGAQP